MSQKVELSPADRDALVKAMENPPKESPKVVEALRRYRESLKRGNTKDDVVED